MGKEFNERIAELSKYGISVNVYEANFIVSISYPAEWKILNPKDKNILMSQAENNPHLFYYAMSCQYDIGLIFDTIEGTIDYNKAIEMKISLFKEKVAELQGIFAETDYNELKQLQFVLPKQMKKRGRKKTTPKVETEKPVEQVTEPAVEIEEVAEQPTTNPDASEIDAKVAMALKQNKSRK